MNWVSNNVALLTLFITTVLVAITFLYVLITRRMLQVSCQPSIAIRRKSVSINPDLPDGVNISEDKDDLGEGRYCIAFEFDLANIGNHPAQNIFFDAEAYFKVSKPLGLEVLPVHLPEFVPFLSSQDKESGNIVTVFARFDNYVARELLHDFFRGRQDTKGMPFLPTSLEMQDRSLWPSARILVHCFYSDIQGQNYVSESQFFFHVWRDSEHKKLGIYILNMQELEFIGIRRVSKRFWDNHIRNNRHKRYMAFSGEKQPKNTLWLMSRA